MKISGMPPLISLGMILWANFLFNVSFYIIVPSATEYSKSLGGGTLFSGLTIGIVTLTSAVSLFPVSRVSGFRRDYKPSLHLASGCLLVGNLLYALADKAGFLYLILIGRALSGFGFTGWFFVKRYCTDPRIVKARRRTMCSSLLVCSQTMGMVAGPILGGQLAKVNVNKVFNAKTMPGWCMVVAWAVFWLATHFLFEEVIDNVPDRTNEEVTTEGSLHVTPRDIVVAVVMSVSAFTVFFELGSWESAIPIYAQKNYKYNEWHSGNFIGLVGFGSVVIVGVMPYLANKLQDRVWLLSGFLVGIVGCGANTLLLLWNRNTVAWYGVQWFLVCAGFNAASIITLSLTSKNLSSNKLADNAAMFVQLSNYTGRLIGAIWGTSSSRVGDRGVAYGQLTVAALAIVGMAVAWRLLRAVRG